MEKETDLFSSETIDEASDKEAPPPEEEPLQADQSDSEQTADISPAEPENSEEFAPKEDFEQTLSEAEITYTSRKEIKKVRKKKKKILYAIIPVACLIIIFLIFLALPLTAPKNTILSNVTSGNISLGKMTVNQAKKELEKKYIPKSTDCSVIFEYDGQTKTTSFNSKDIKLSADFEKTADLAYQIARSNNTFKNSWDILRLFFTDIDIGVVPVCDEEKLSDIFYELGASVYGHSEDAQYIIEDDTLTVIPPTPGQSHNVSDAISEFLASVQSGVYKDIPITLKSNDADKLNADEIYEKLSAEPKNAEYKIEGNQVTITDHVVGISIDRAKFKSLIAEVNNGNKASMEIVQTIPDVTKEDLQKSLFGTTLASFSSNYASSSANRAYNVELASSKINGIVLADGAEFSYNSVIGNPNLSNGYKMATVFSDGKVTEGVGGGVCQVSSTLYCAVLRADLKIIERHNHSLPIAYVPGGQDATVSYGSLDFRFKNNTGAPIKIVSSSSGRNLTISIVGSASAKKNVEVTSQKVASIEPTMTEIKDASLPAGQRKVVSSGKSGGVYMTYKKVYNQNGTLVSEDKIKSSYRATPGEVIVGTGAASSPASTTPAPAAEPVSPEPSAPAVSEEPTPSQPAEEEPISIETVEDP